MCILSLVESLEIVDSVIKKLSLVSGDIEELVNKNLTNPYKFQSTWNFKYEACTVEHLLAVSRYNSIVRSNHRHLKF